MPNKLAKIQQTLQAQQIDALVLIPGPNMKYMTGIDFHLMERPIIGLFMANGMPTFILPEFEESRLADNEIGQANTFTYADGQLPIDAIKDAFAALPTLKSIAVEYLNMRVLELTLLQSQFPDLVLKDAEPIMGTLRLYKTQTEISAMREAIGITERALEAVLGEIKPGMTEIDVVNRLRNALSEAGGESLPFDPLVQAGQNAARPHGQASETVIHYGDLLLIDFGTTKRSYLSDMTRVFYVGKAPDEEAKHIHETVLKANAAGRAAAKPGVTCEAVDRATRAVIEQAGYGEYFIHRTGHGIGLEAHEQPYIVEGNQLVLQPGMTFTVEPGIYIPGKLGVRIEDDVLIAENGAESLTQFDRGIRVIGTLPV